MALLLAFFKFRFDIQYKSEEEELDLYWEHLQVTPLKRPAKSKLVIYYPWSQTFQDQAVTAGS